MSKDTNFQFPPSPQSDLFNYLRPEQQEFVKPILRVLKKPAQEELCCALLDYLEKGIELPPVDFTLSGLFIYITRAGMPEEDDPNDRRILRPLHVKGEGLRMRGEGLNHQSPLTHHPSPNSLTSHPSPITSYIKQIMNK